jgi:hypothetical protein
MVIEKLLEDMHFALLELVLLKDPPNVHFHFTPTSASWINQVEIWFGILSRKACMGSDRSETFG